MKSILQTEPAPKKTPSACVIAASDVDEETETVDALFQGKLKLAQARAGYRFSLDAVLLAHFVTVRAREKIVDLGTGNGVIPLILAFVHPSVSISGIEFQTAMANRARRNIELNDLNPRIEISQGDVRAIKNIAAPQSFHVVVCNPPYRRPASGRISPNPEKRIARHECEGNLCDFIEAGAYLLPAKGRMALVYSAVRAVELLILMGRARIEPKRVRWVHSFAQTDASLILVEGIKGGRSGVQVDAPLVVYQENKKYTAEVEALLRGRVAPVQGSKVQ